MFKVQVQAAKHQEGWGWWWGRAKEEGAKAKAEECRNEQVLHPNIFLSNYDWAGFIFFLDKMFSKLHVFFSFSFFVFV